MSSDPQLREAAEKVTRTPVSFYEPRHLHPSSVIFEAISHVRQFIVPAILGLFSAAQGGFWGAGLATVVFAGALISTLMRYFTLRYQIKDNEFVVTEGLLFRRVRSVPIRRIQNMDLIQNVLHRIFGVAQVNIETASGTKPEATLRVLTHRQIDELREALFGGEAENGEAEAVAEEFAGREQQNDSPVGSESNPDGGMVELPLPLVATGVSPRNHSRNQTAVKVYQIPLRDLVLAGLTSNRGAVLLGIAVGFFFQADLDDRLNFDFLRGYAEQSNDPFQFGILALAGFLALLLILRMVGIAWYILRFFDYQLRRQGDDLRISCGLFTKVSATVPRRRIQFISVHRSFLMRWLGLAAIRVETAGGAGSENENAATTVSRRWFLPVVRSERVNEILSELRPDIHWDSHTLFWHGVSPRTGRRLIRISAIASVFVGAVGLAIAMPWGWLAGVALFPPLAFLAIKKSRARRYARADWGIAYQSGLFTRKLSFAFYDRIQTLEVSQTPFDKRWEMATLRIDTAAAGPAEHTIEVSFLDASFALSQFDDLQTAAAVHRPSWT